MKFNAKFMTSADLFLACMALPEVTPAQGTKPTPDPVQAGPGTDSVVNPEGKPGANPAPKVKKRYTDPMCLEIGGEFVFDFQNPEGNNDAQDITRSYNDRRSTFNLRLGPLLAIFLNKGFQIGAIPTFSFAIRREEGRKGGTRPLYYTAGSRFFLDTYSTPEPLPFLLLEPGWAHTAGKTRATIMKTILAMS